MKRKYGQCWSNYDNEGFLLQRFCYAVDTPADYIIFTPQVKTLRNRVILAGFMSEARGLHWDRKSRYGRK